MREAVLANITAARLIELAQHLIGIPSETGSERSIADYVGHFLTELGLAVSEIEVEDSGPTIVGYLSGRDDAPRFMVSFHLDTFPRSTGWTRDPYHSPPEENRLYGLGSHDMKGGAACVLGMIEALAHFSEHLNGTLVVAATTDEELWSRGAHALIEGGYLEGCVGALVPEPTPPQALRVGSRGRHVFQVDLLGKTASAAYSGEGINAVDDAASIIRAIRNGGLRLASHVGYQMSTSLTVTDFYGAERQNTILVPERATVMIDGHLVPGDSVERVWDALNTLIRELGIRSSYTIYADRRPSPAPLSYEVDQGLPFVQSAIARMEEEIGVRPALILSRSVSDANHFVVYGGIPTLIYGPQGGNTAQADEYVLTDSLLPVARTYAQVIMDVLGLA